ncbi:MAG: hypothetical protein U0359_15120 [Byssovorax sp.]
MATRTVSVALGLAGAALAALLAGVALATAAPVRLDYQAGPGCPAEKAFLGAVRALTPNAQAPSGEGPARRFTVRIERAGAQHVGRLRIEEVDGTQAEREVRAPTCQDVVSALALVTALAIDAGPIEAPAPSASVPPAPSASAPPASSTGARPPGSASPSASASAAPSASAPTSPTALPTASPSAAPSAAPAPGPGLRLELGAEGMAYGAMAPGVSWGGSAFVDLSDWGTSGLARSFRLGFLLAASLPVQAGEGHATFRLSAARLGACPALLTLGRLVARPCAGLDFGALHGEAIVVSRAQTPVWADVSAGLRLQLSLGRGFVLEGEGGLIVPLIRYGVQVEDPITVIHTVPVVSGSGALGVGWLLP